MFNFIHYNSAPTDQNQATNISSFSPSIYFGNKLGGFVNNYDPYDAYTLKHFKVSVCSLDLKPILRLDTIDLYHKVDHSISNSFPSSDLLSEISTSCPIKFNRIHFCGILGDHYKEFYSNFLCGYPVDHSEQERFENMSDIVDKKKWSEYGNGNEDSLESYRERLILGGIPLYKALSDSSGSTVSCKRVNPDGSLAGEEVSFGVIPPPEDSP